MNLRICSYLSGSFLLENESNKWDSIVIVDPAMHHTNFASQYSKRSLILKFDDVATYDTSKTPPNVNDIETAVNFSMDSEGLVVCCRAGQSRSAAVALVIQFRLHGARAFNLLAPERHCPNQLIVSLGAEVIDRPDLISEFMSWKRVNENLTPINFLDDIEKEVDELERKGARNRICRPSTTGRKK